MSKKVTALFFILIANFILLAHAVVPHNHHHGQICVKDSHEQTHHHGQNAVEHDHDEDENSNDDYCSLKQIFISRASQYKQVCKYVIIHDNDDDFVPFQALLNDVGIKLDSKFLRVKAKIPDISFLPIRLVNLGIGLRAPPVV